MKHANYHSVIQISSGTIKTVFNLTEGNEQEYMSKTYSAVVRFIRDNTHYLNFCDPDLSRLPHIQMFYGLSNEDIGIVLRAETSPDGKRFCSEGTELESIKIELSSFNTPTDNLESTIRKQIRQVLEQ